MSLRNLYIAYGITIGLHVIYGLSLLTGYLRAKTKIRELGQPN